MDYYRDRQAAQDCLDRLLQDISRLKKLQDSIQQKRQQLVHDIALENYFTEEECRTIYLLYRDSSYNNSNILVTSIDDSDSEIDTMYELLQDGMEQASVLSRPQLTFRIDSDNLLGLPEFRNLWTDFRPGNYMLVQYRDDTWMKLRMVDCSFNPCLPPSASLSVTFSNYIRSRSEVSDLENMLGLSDGSSSLGSSGSSGGSGGTYGESDDIDVTISNTMLSKLLNSEAFGTRVTNVILDTIDVNALTARLATFGGLAEGTTTVNGKCITTGYITDNEYEPPAGNAGSADNTKGSIINLETGKFNFGGGNLKWDGTILAVNGKITAAPDSVIGGWTIGSNTIHAQNDSLYTTLKRNGTVAIGLGSSSPEDTANAKAQFWHNGTVKLGYTPSGYNFTADASGNVAMKGAVTADSGEIGGFTISRNKIYAGDASTGVIVMQKPSDSTAWSFAVGGTSHSNYSDCPFRVSHQGSLYAKDAVLDSAVLNTAVLDSAVLNTAVLNGNITVDNLIVKNSIFMYAADEYSNINSRCKIIYFNHCDGNAGNHYYELVIGKRRHSSLGDDEDSSTALFYERTRIIGMLNAGSLQVNEGISFGNLEGYAVSKGISMPWADSSNHYVVGGNEDGLTCYFGWSGKQDASDTDTYKTVSVIRGQTVKCSDSSGSTVLSDERMKKDFTALDRWEAFYDSARPLAFRMKNGSSSRYHIGFKAGQIKDALERNGLTTQDFAGFVATKYTPDKEDPPADIELHIENGIRPGDEEYGLIYTEFIALNTHMIQKLQAKVRELENTINERKG